MSSFVRSYAINQFNKQFNIKPKNAQHHGRILNNLNKVEQVYRPHRYFKRKSAPPPNIDARVQITLLEYGYKSETHGSQIGGTDHKDVETEEIEQVRILIFFLFSYHSYCFSNSR